jgi:hypothetical protein
MPLNFDIKTGYHLAGSTSALSVHLVTDSFLDVKQMKKSKQNPIWPGFLERDSRLQSDIVLKVRLNSNFSLRILFEKIKHRI